MRNQDRNDDSQHNPSGRTSGRPSNRTHGRRRGNKRGDVRAAALLLLAEQPRHGYQLIQEISERSNGIWTPSPGSIYPVLAQLEDEGLASFERIDGRKIATLTEEGSAYVEEKREDLGIPWEMVQSDRSFDERKNLGQALKGFVNAWKQVIEVGTPEQQHEATTLLQDARKSMYRILAGDEQTR